MKRIKSFKLFESVEDNSELVSIINDMSLDLTDKDFYFFETNWNTYRPRGWGRKDRLSFILNKGENPFFFSEIKSVVEDMIHFMESEGWWHRIEFVFYDEYEMGSGDITGGVDKNGELCYSLDDDDEKVVDKDCCPISNFIIIFNKEVVNEAWDSFDSQREEIKSIVGDMLLELDFQDIKAGVWALSDKVVQVELKKTVKDRKSAILFGDKDENRGFEWSDVESVINDVSDYLLKEWGLKPHWEGVPQTDVRANWEGGRDDDHGYDSCMFLRWTKSGGFGEIFL